VDLFTIAKSGVYPKNIFFKIRHSQHTIIRVEFVARLLKTENVGTNFKHKFFNFFKRDGFRFMISSDVSFLFDDDANFK
jgi:hypothetical protein